MPSKIVYGDEAWGACQRGKGKRKGVGDTCTFACPDYRVGMLNLTRQEQTVMILILIALLVGAGIRHIRLNAMLPGRRASFSGFIH
jgi:hypothetical protein